jgi:hypothetical protein
MTVDAVGVFCNTLLIIVILTDPLNVLRKGAWLTILNLSFADLIAGVSNFVFIGLSSYFRTSNTNVPAAFLFLWMFGVGGSFLLLTFLTIETYVIVKYPIRSRFILSGKKIWSSCVVSWILAAILGLSNIAYKLFADLELAQLMKIYIAQIAVLEFAVIVQVVLKVLIIREIVESGRNMADARTEQRNNKHKEIAKTIVMLNVILIVTAFPYFVAKQIEYLYKWGVIGGDSLARLFSNYYEPVALLNFTLNPVLYSLRLSEYRHSLLALFCKSRRERDCPKRFASMKTAMSVKSGSSFRAVDQESTKL